MPSLEQQLAYGLPQRQGLYNPALEKDSCGVGFICDIKGRASREIVDTAGHMNCCMVHRGGLGYEQNTGDGAGILTALSRNFPLARLHRVFARSNLLSTPYSYATHPRRDSPRTVPTPDCKPAPYATRPKIV